MATFCTYLFLLSVTFPIFINLSSSSSEGDILLSFKDSIEDSSKKALSSWSNTSSNHYCNWTGISCSSSTKTPPVLSVTSINLQSLNLSGDISSSICDLPNLSHLNLADNIFNQPIPLHLSQCSSLQTLNLSTNLIWGTIPSQVSQFSSLRVLDLSRNHIEGNIPESLGSLKNLQVLNMGSNLLSGNVPAVFGNLSKLEVLDLSQNPYLVSEIPEDIGELGNLKQLLLQSSSFQGEIPESLVGLLSLTHLDLSENNLTGGVPKALVSSLKNLVSFDVSQNKLVGPFPSGVCKGQGLINLSLHTNTFTGPIPNSIGDCKSLERFQVQNNGFSGDFPIGLWSLPKVKLIRAENNRFSGQIPESISGASQLEQVQLDNNTFAGKIPQGLGFVKSLYRFSASLNSFYGELPPNFCDSPVMSIVNLSHNSLSGKIPELRKCRKLVSLSLADNSLTGEIPPSFAELPVLTYLDLSDNNLTGSIPQGLQNLKLALFNVSFNQLSGKVPYSLISGLPASFLEGNPGLCGPGLPNSCSDEPPRHHRVGGLTTLTCALISLAFVAGTAIVVGGFILYRRSCKGSQVGVWRSVFFYPLRITEHDLLIGMNEKSSVGNGGVFGKVYVVSLPSGELVSVKKLVNFGNQSSRSLKSEVKTLAKIRHKNVVKILGFCHSDESVFLIYEYLHGGSLGDLISSQNFQLQWGVRLKIAIGVAQGLAYLHKDYVPHLLHRNVKSRNILLDANFEPKLTHFALDRIVGEAAFQSTLDSEAASSCYIAPEYGYSKKATEQLDVYSFGVVLLELVCGRQAEETDSTNESIDIVKWVRRKVNITNGVHQVLDTRILSHTCHQQMVAALDIALRCTSVVPEKRPPMVQVVRGLQSLESRACVADLQGPNVEEELMQPSNIKVSNQEYETLTTCLAVGTNYGSMNMASFAGNIGFKFSCQLRSPVFSIPRTIWKFQIACLKSRGFSSSVPVRYIPNTSSRVKIPETSLSVKSLQKCGFADVSVPKINGRKDGHATIAHCETSQNPEEIHSDILLFDDSEEGSEQMEEIGELTVHHAGDSSEQDLIRVDKFTNDVEQSAIKFLASRALTAVELRKKLLGKRFSPNAVEAVINKFQREGMINDRLYAESFSQSRWSSSSWGPRRIKQALFKKGVSQADAEKAIEVVFKDNDCAEDQKSVIGLSKHSMDHLYAQASKQWFRGQNVSKETRKSRIVRWLQYRGFDWNVISYILKRLDRQEQNPP